MRKRLRSIIWSAVIATALAVACVAFAVAQIPEVSVALGLSAITAAILSNRDAR